MDLVPKYGYFNFAEVTTEDKKTTNTLYGTLLNAALQKVAKKHKPTVIEALNLFNVKKTALCLNII